MYCQGTDCRHGLRPIDKGNTLLCSQCDGPDSRSFHCLSTLQSFTLIERLALSNHHKDHMSKRGEISTRSHRALLWYHGDYSRIQHLYQSLYDLHTYTRESFGKSICPQQHHPSDDVLGKRFPHTSTVTSYQIHLKLSKVVLCNEHPGQFSKARVHSVDSPALPYGILNNTPTLQYPLTGGLIKCDFSAVSCNQHDVFDSQTLAIN